MEENYGNKSDSMKEIKRYSKCNSFQKKKTERL